MARRTRPVPQLTTDAVLFGLDPAGLRVLLVERARPPFAGAWALPGGYLEPEELPVVAAARELVEETGVQGVELVPLAPFGAPGRDPRGCNVSLAYLGILRTADAVPVAGDDAALARWHSLLALPTLAFDHATILETAKTELADRRPPTLRDGEAPPRAASLILVAGLTGSGKSTFCRALAAVAPNLVYLDIDQLRRDLTNDTPHYGELEAWTVHNSARALAEWCLRRGHDVAIDATGLTAADRAHYLASAPLFGARSILVWCETDEAEARRRLAHRKAGRDPLNRWKGGIEFRHRSTARLEKPRIGEADQTELVHPDNSAAVAARLGAGLAP
jgi:8-oxo-dGTP diphosphatase